MKTSTNVNPGKITWSCPTCHFTAPTGGRTWRCHCGKLFMLEGQLGVEASPIWR